MRALMWSAVGVALGLGLVTWTAAAEEPTPLAAWIAMQDRACAFLRKSQAEDGSWSKERSIGITGIVLTGLLESGRVDRNDPMIRKALGYLESLINTKAGHLAGPDPRPQLKNYVTAVNVMAFAAADRSGKYRDVVAAGAQFLKGLQWDDSEGHSPKDWQYGGFGYDSKSRPDLSNGNLALDALRAAGINAQDPVMKKAAIFVSRCQNLQGEHNDQPWADKINDGSFIYSPQETKGDPREAALPGYGSMTYAGIKSLIYAGVSPDDPRVTTALAWIRKHYTVDANPGLPPSRAQAGLFYYYHTMAKCLTVLKLDTIVDDQGVRHDWRTDLNAALRKRQNPDGSWTNPHDRWMEGDPNLVTGFALMTLSYTKPK